VLEDVTTTGGSLIQTLEQLQALDIPILGALSLTDRLEPRDDGRYVRDVLEEMGVPFYTLCDARALLPAAIAHYQPADSIQQHLRDERSALNAFNPFQTEETR
jgi:orotate phosphoribosyltransferase